MAVSRKRNYHHDDIEYTDPKLTNAQSNMFYRILSHFDNNHTRLYNSVDGIYDIPKIRLYDTDSLQKNTDKVYNGSIRIRQAFHQFANSPIVKKSCLGVFANFEYTVYKKKKKSYYSQGYYTPKYSMFHPHLHITFIVKPHHPNLIDRNSLVTNQLSDVRTSIDKNQLINRLSDGDYVEMNRAWNQASHSKFNHFYMKDTYVKSHSNQHVRDYWSIGWGKPSSYPHARNNAFGHASPLSRPITSADTDQTVKAVTDDIGRESNKYRGLVHAFYHGLDNHDVKNIMNNAVQKLNRKIYTRSIRNFRYRHYYSYQDPYTQQKILKNSQQSAIQNGLDIKKNMTGLKATYYGFYQHRNEFPRHMYTGKLQDYAQRYIYPKFPYEAKTNQYFANHLLHKQVKSFYPNFHHTWHRSIDSLLPKSHNHSTVQPRLAHNSKMTKQQKMLKSNRMNMDR